MPRLICSGAAYLNHHLEAGVCIGHIGITAGDRYTKGIGRGLHPADERAEELLGQGGQPRTGAP